MGFWCVSEAIVPVSRACRLEYLRTPHEGHKAFLDRVAPTPQRTRPARVGIFCTCRAQVQILSPRAGAGNLHRGAAQNVCTRPERVGMFSTCRAQVQILSPRVGAGNLHRGAARSLCTRPGARRHFLHLLGASRDLIAPRGRRTFAQGRRAKRLERNVACRWRKPHGFSGRCARLLCSRNLPATLRPRVH